MLLDMDVKVKGKKITISTVSDDKTCQVFMVEAYFCLFEPTFLIFTLNLLISFM